MKIYAIFAFLLGAASFYPNVSAFCGTRRLSGDLSRAAVHAAEWIQSQLDNNTPGHVFAAASHTLRLVGHSVSKDGVARLKAEIEKVGLSAIPTGRVALYVNAIASACKDPNDFYGHDLIRSLKTGINGYPIPGKFDHPYPYSLALLALCGSDNIEGFPVDYAFMKKVIKDGIADGHGTDTVAMTTMALSCIKESLPGDRAHNLKRRSVARLIKKATNWMNKLQKPDGSFGNSITTALVVQALLSAEVKPKKWKCSKTMTFLLRSQQRPGSFQNYVMSTAQVLPALIGAIPHDVKDIKCLEGPPVYPRHPITVCVRVEFLTTPNNGTSPSAPPPVSVTVLNGTAAYEILTLAAKQNSCYQFKTVNSAYGRSIVSICGVAKDGPSKKYWITFKDANNWAPTGIDSFKPKDGSCVIFKYMKLEFR